MAEPVIPTPLDPLAGPTLEAQRTFWTQWTHAWRSREGMDDFMRRQAETAIRWARGAGLQSARILDVGCGTGWLGNALTNFGDVTGTDLSPGAIEEDKRRHPNIELLCGDFLTLDLPDGFDLVVSADTIAHVYDQPAFVARIARLLAPAGTFILMTQNPTVWLRRSTLAPLQPGQIRSWLPLNRIRELLRPRFEIRYVTSIVPGGNVGALWWVENRYVLGIARRVVGEGRWTALLERALLGRELVVVARLRN